ncbi:bifunctional DNA primase/polymerase [Roseovarius sp. S4756]|uniref:bifunctional DNA primase/polymerase n=1 Tax=Roseovarius maritimus TaxID=3342637 RepID=UPI00372835CC
MRNSFRVEGDMKSSSITKAALAWVKQGAKIIALHGIYANGKCTCGKPRCRNSGKHPIAELFPKGQNSATNNVGKIRQAFAKHPNANLGVILPSNLVALDVDGPEGEAALRDLNLKNTPTVRTGRGQHHYFKLTQTLPKAKVSLPQVDIKDDANGYIVVPPSMHKSGKRYRWIRTKKPITPLPASFIRSLERVSKQSVSLANKVKIKAGGRNNELTGIAGFLRYRGLGETAISAALQALNVSVCNPPLDHDEVDRIAASVAKYEAGHEDAFGWLGDVEESEVEFLAHPYIVKGATTVLDGHMGVGKSTFTAAIASAVTTGKPPPFLDQIEKGSVLFMSAEDDASRVLKPRLMKAEADVSKIRYQEEPFTLDERGMALLRQELTANTPALVIIDPIIAFMKEGTDGNKANETMHFMVQLDQLARDFDTAILIVRHLRKARADQAMHQGIGSISISARVRSGLILGIHPNDREKRAVAHAKANYSELGPTIVFKMENTGPRSHPRIVWHPSEPELFADDVLAGPEGDRGRPPKERDTATIWLEGLLRKGSAKKKVLDHKAKENGISQMTLRRAAETLGVRKSKDGKESVWSLP